MDNEKNECIGCQFYDAEEDRCTAFECWGLGLFDGCPPLPCEDKKFKKSVKNSKKY